MTALYGDHRPQTQRFRNCCTDSRQILTKGCLLSGQKRICRSLTLCSQVLEDMLCRAGDGFAISSNQPERPPKGWFSMLPTRCAGLVLQAAFVNSRVKCGCEAPPTWAGRDLELTGPRVQQGTSCSCRFLRRERSGPLAWQVLWLLSSPACARGLR